MDLDGVLVVAHSDKQDAAPTWKKTYGHHPLMGFVDHGPGGTGEPVAAHLRPGNAGSNTAADHITVTRLALAQLRQSPRRSASCDLPSRSRSERHGRLHRCEDVAQAVSGYVYPDPSGVLGVISASGLPRMADRSSDVTHRLAEFRQKCRVRWGCGG